MLRTPLHGLDQAALLRFHADEGGHDGAHTELRNVSAEDRASSGPAMVPATSSPKWRRTKSATDSSCAGADALSSAARFGSRR